VSTARRAIRDEADKQGTIGLGWSLVGLNLIYLAYVAALVKRFGNWGHQMWELPNPVKPNSEFVH
jgi:hypothetical protein